MERTVMLNKHQLLLVLDMEKGTVQTIVQVIDTDHLPVFLQDNLTVGTINEWLAKRRIPDTREGLSAMRSDFPGFEQYRCMFSLSDQYWFRYRKEETWEGLNYFTNPYSEDLGRAFFTPWEFERGHIFPSSPDLMTNGALRKRWTREEDGTSFLIKAGSRKLRQEPITEVLASLMLKKLDIIPFVEYELVVEGLRLCSKCRNFVDKDTEFVPASHIYYKEPRKKTDSVYTHLMKMCSCYGVKDAKEYIDAMIAADHILGNDDRHLGNFGFIRDVETAGITGFAPLFDSGSSYGAISGKPGTSKLFHEKEKMAVRKAAKKIDPLRIRDHEEAYCLIDTYPEITRAQKDALTAFIERMEEELAMENSLEMEEERNEQAR